MTIKLTTEQVWQAIEKEVFAVLGMVTTKCESRTAGIVYVVKNRRLYIASGADARVQLENIKHATERIAELEAQERDLLKELAEKGGVLSQKRQGAAV